MGSLRDGYTLATSPPAEARGWAGWAGWAGWTGLGVRWDAPLRAVLGGWWGGSAAVLTYYRAMSEEEPAAARRAMLSKLWSAWRDEILADLGAAHLDYTRCSILNLDARHIWRVSQCQCHRRGLHLDASAGKCKRRALHLDGRCSPVQTQRHL